MTFSPVQSALGELCFNFATPFGMCIQRPEAPLKFQLGIASVTQGGTAASEAFAA